MLDALEGAAEHCYMDPDPGEWALCPSISVSAGRAADGIEPCGIQRAVEHGHADGGFGAPARQAAGA